MNFDRIDYALRMILNEVKFETEMRVAGVAPLRERVLKLQLSFDDLRKKRDREASRRNRRTEL